ncbi:MAG TPA: YceI family protein [Thermoanaerobaculia bacterium]|nr:YceI family protein [Thermoanaerobaculia bacterium]
MRRIATGFAALLLLALAAPVRGQTPPPAAAGVREFTVDDAWGRDTVQFRTTAPLEDIVGTTNEVTGYLRADPKNLAGPGTAARLEVALNMIKTGIEMRDGHVARALGADTAPVAVFTLEKIKSATPSSLEPNVTANVTGEGTLELKGVRKKVDVGALVTFVPKGGPFNQMRPGNFVKLVATFDIRLADFGVERKGQVLPLQVGELAHVTVTVLASDATPEEAKAYRETAVKYMGKPRK